MRANPIIIWKLPKSVKQTSMDCVFFALSDYFELLGYDITPQNLEDMIRKELNDYEGGVNMKKAFEVLRRKGYIKLPEYVYEDPENINIILKYSPLIASFNRWEDNYEGNEYHKGGKARETKHAVLIMGMNDEGYQILDSHRPNQYMTLPYDIAEDVINYICKLKLSDKIKLELL